MKSFKIRKKAQEEMVGFALIMIIVAVILVIFLGFYLRSPQKEIVESYEVNSFIQALLQYTSNCEESYESNYLSIKKLIIACDNEETCFNGEKSCEVLNLTLKEIAEESWKIGEDNPVKGYELKIDSGNRTKLKISEGNITKNFKSSMQDFSIGGNSMKVFFTSYY